MGKTEEQNNVETPFILKGGVEKTVGKKVKKEKQELTDMEEKISGLQNVAEEMHNYVDELIADNKAEIAYLKTRQREEELEIKNRQENVKRLQEQRKAIRREERERQKLYNTLKSDNIGLTKINVATNKTSNYHPLENKVEPLIKSKQNQLVNQDEKNRLKNEYRASLFYPDDTEETKLYLATQKQIEEKRTQEQKAQLEKQIEARNNAKTLPISDVEKTLFPDGNLAEMDFAKSKELGEKSRINPRETQFEVDKQKLIDKIKNTEINIDTLGKIKIYELIPNIDEYLNLPATEDELILEIMYPSMGIFERLEKDISLLSRAIKAGIKILKEDFGLTSEEKELFEKIKKLESFSEMFSSFFKTKKMIEHYINSRYSKVKSYFRISELLERIPQEELTQMVEDFLYGSAFTGFFAERLIGEDASGLLRFSSNNPDINVFYLKDAQIYNSFNELPDKYREFIKKKINSQNLDDDTMGALFPSYSAISKRILEDKDFRNIILENVSFENFVEGKDVEISYANGIEFNERNLKYAIRRADIINLKIDVFGNVSGDIVDTTDYNEPSGDLKLVRSGYELQKKEKIVPKFIIIHFVIPKNEFK